MHIAHRIIFTSLHGMQMRSSNENSVCPSVCLFVKRVNCDKTEEKFSRFLYRTKVALHRVEVQHRLC